MSYNSGGKRYKKTKNCKDNYYVYSGEKMLYEESVDGTVKIRHLTISTGTPTMAIMRKHPIKILWK